MFSWPSLMSICSVLCVFSVQFFGVAEVYAGGEPIQPRIGIEDFTKVDIRIGRVVDAKPNKGLRNASYILSVDFGSGIGVLTTSTQLPGGYDVDQLVGRQVVCVMNFAPRKIGQAVSQVMVMGVYDAGARPVLLVPDPVPAVQEAAVLALRKAEEAEALAREAVLQGGGGDDVQTLAKEMLRAAALERRVAAKVVEIWKRAAVSESSVSSERADADDGSQESVEDVALGGRPSRAIPIGAKVL